MSGRLSSPLPIPNTIKTTISWVRFYSGVGRNLLALVAFVLVSAYTLDAQDFTSKVAQYMRAQVEVNHFSGSILIAQNGRVLIRKRYGPMREASDEDAASARRYRIGSIAKQFIAVAVLQLQERGRLRLQDPVCKYIARCPNGWEQIKIFNLLAQTDGIPEISRPFDSKTLKSTATTAGLLAYLDGRPLEFKPGEKLGNGGSGYAVLGAAIETISGEPYLRYLKKHIFTPAGMRATGYEDAVQTFPDTNVAHTGRSNSITPNDLESAIPYSFGRLYSTVEDLYRWNHALNGEELLSKASGNAMFTPYLDGYGFGWVILKEFERRLETQGGGIYLWGASIRRYVDDDVCIIALSDSDNADAGRISRDLAANLFGKHYELPIAHVAIHIDPTIYDSYVGRYELTPDFFLVVTRETNRLMIQSPSQPKIELLAESETRFFAKRLDAVVTFVKSPQGRADQLVLQQGGRDISAARTP